MNDLEIHLQIWNELKTHLVGGDITGAADDFIRVLIENGISATDILEHTNDQELHVALQEYVEVDIEEFEEEED